MTVREFIELFTDEESQYFELWDISSEETIFKGYLEDLSEDLENATVSSIDNIYECENTKGIMLNVEI